jgi:hypothetical protein
MAGKTTITTGQGGEDLATHERDYKAFNVLIRWCMTLLASSLAFLTLWFATGTGFWGAAIVGVVLLFLGYGFLVRGEEDKPVSDFSPDH